GKIGAQLAVPIELSPAALSKPGALAERLEHQTPIQAVVTVAHLDLKRFPFGQLGVATPITAGTLDGSIKLLGTLHRPELDADFEARAVATNKLNQVDLDLSLDYKNARAQLTSELRL